VRPLSLAPSTLVLVLVGSTDPSLVPADPKTVLCAFHKVGKCTKGCVPLFLSLSSCSCSHSPLTHSLARSSKCKFSHDLSADRKGAKASVYADQRDEKKQGPAEGSSASPRPLLLFAPSREPL